MYKKPPKWPSFSEIRGICLVIIGSGALYFYYSWWFQQDRLTSVWLVLGFVTAVAYGGVQILGNWLIYLATHHRFAKPSSPATSLTVDVFVTAYRENPALIERCLKAACAMQGPHRTWLLDDGRDPYLAEMAQRLGAGYLTRADNKDAKAGNLNAALARTDGDVVIIFDIDHAPTLDFLEKTLPYFADPTIGFVQVMLTFGNGEDGWIAQAAGESSLDFYNPTSIGADGLRSATLVGSNALIRRRALAAIGGYKPGLAEDLATSIALHGSGWRSVYVAEPLAPGYAPPDLAAWFTQQLKWARGVFELFLTAYPRLFARLKLGQKISYAVRMTYYWIGPVVALHLLATLLNLFRGRVDALASFDSYLVHLVPLGMITAVIRQLAFRRWRHKSLKLRMQWRAMLLVYATWPIYTLAWLMAVLRLPLSFRPTPKTASDKLSPLWLLPQAVTSLLLILGLVYAYRVTRTVYPFVFAFTVVQAAAQLLLLGQRLLQNGRGFYQQTHRSLHEGVRPYQIAPAAEIKSEQAPVP